MRKFLPLLVLLILLVHLACGSEAVPFRGVSAVSKTQRYVVKLRVQPPPVKLLKITEGLGAQYVNGGFRTPYLLLKPDGDKSVRLKGLKGLVEYIEPEVTMHMLRPPAPPPPHAWIDGKKRLGTPAVGVRPGKPLKIKLAPDFPSDPLFSHQWGFQETGYGIHLPSARNLSRGGGVIVGIVDTGVKQNLSDLVRGDFLPSFNAITNGVDGQDDEGHGSHVCGTIAQVSNNGIGGSGIAPLCRILSVKALDSHGVGSNFTIGSAIRYAVDHGAQVINLSLGGVKSRTLEDAVKYALEKGTTLCCAAGNDGTQHLDYPAAYPGVIAVGAINAQGRRANFSQYGSGLTLVAPGVDILQQTFDRKTGRTGFFYYSGTSMATPMVTGVAALLKALDPKLTPAGIKEILIRTARRVGSSGNDLQYGAGRLDAQAACEAVIHNRPPENVPVVVPPVVPVPVVVPPAPPTPVTPPVVPGPGDNADPIISQTLTLFNQERARAGLQPLVINDILNRAAWKHCQDMQQHGQLTHTGSDGSNPGQRMKQEGYSWATWGEIVAVGQPTPEAVVLAWMNSPGHRAIILGQQFREVGIGKVDLYWCGDFGTR